MKKNSIHPAIRAAAAKVQGKRPRTVIDLILKNGMVTTEDLERIGYAHPPRAARDVRENGIPLETFRVKGKSGKMIAAYKFGDPEQITNSKLGGRKVFSKEFKTQLIQKYGARCAICNESYEERFLQIDHRVPYEVSGDLKVNDDPSHYMLLCASCNRKKSWTCEHCPNWIKEKNPRTCQTCFWASPKSYTHVALNKTRQSEIVWQGDDDVKRFETLKKEAEKQGLDVNEYIKKQLRRKPG